MFRQLIAGAAAAVIALTGVKSGQYSPDEFYRAEGGVIVSPAGETAVLRGMGFLITRTVSGRCRSGGSIR